MLTPPLLYCLGFLYALSLRFFSLPLFHVPTSFLRHLNFLYLTYTILRCTIVKPILVTSLSHLVAKILPILHVEKVIDTLPSSRTLRLETRRKDS
jgi:hypothetical protein